jgi:glutamate racemase
VNTNPDPGTRNLEHPIGIFDSGVGGLSVLLEVRRELPHEDLLYVADSGHAPYGEKPVDFIERRATRIVHFFIEQGAKAVVVACNTATGTAIESLRARWPLPIIGIEPAIKPAVAATTSHVIGVLATTQTIASARFARLVDAFGSGVAIVAQACPGLVEQIEKGDLSGGDTRALIDSYVRPLVEQGADTLVLGCTHYPFVRDAIAAVAGPGVTIIDPAPAVAREVRRRLAQRGMLATSTGAGTVKFWTSGEPAQLERLLELLGIRALFPEVFDLKLADVPVVRVERFGEDV